MIANVIMSKYLTPNMVKCKKFAPQRLYYVESAGLTAVLGTAWFTWLGLFLDRGVLSDLKSAIQPCFSVAKVLRK